MTVCDRLVEAALEMVDKEPCGRAKRKEIRDVLEKKWGRRRRGLTQPPFYLVFKRSFERWPRLFEQITRVDKWSVLPGLGCYAE